MSAGAGPFTDDGNESYRWMQGVAPINSGTLREPRKQEVHPSFMPPVRSTCKRSRFDTCPTGDRINNMNHQNEVSPLEGRVEQLEKKLQSMNKTLSIMGSLLLMAAFYSVGYAWFGFARDPIGRFEAVTVGQESTIEASLYGKSLSVGRGDKQASINADDGTSLRLDDKTSEIYMSADNALPSISLSAGGVTYSISVRNGQLWVTGGDDELNQMSSAVLHDFREQTPKVP